MLKSNILTNTICFVLVAVLVCTATCGVSLAYTNGSPTDIDTLFGSLSTFSPDVSSNALSAISDHIVSNDSNVLAVCYYASQSDSQYTYVCEHGKLIIGTNNYIFCSSPGETVYFSSVSYFSWSDNGFGLGSDTSMDVSTLSVDGVDYYRTDYALNNFMANNGIVYCSNDFLNNGNIVSYNLDISSYLPDMRFLEVVQQTYFNSDFLLVTADTDIGSHITSFTVYYTDTTGSKFYVFQPYEYLDSFYDNPYSSFKVNVSSIPTVGAFTLTSAELYTDGLWGSKSVSFSYSYDGSEIDLPSSYTDITYFNTFVESEHLSSIGSSFVGTLYFGYYSDTNTYYIRDNLEYLVENFDVKFIALPNFLWNTTGSDTADWDIEEYYELFEMFDVVILGLGETAFDDLYGSGSYYTLNAGWSTGVWGVSAIINRIEKYTPVYHSTLQSLFESNPNDFVWTAYANDIGFVITRNYLLKKVFYSLGDVDSRLLDFESKLLSEDGALSSIETKLVLGLGQNNTGWNVALDGIGRLNAFFDNLLVSGWLDNVTGSLEDIKSLLSTSANDFETLLTPFKAIYDFFKGGLDTGLLWMNEFIGIGQQAFSDDVPLLPTFSPTIPLLPTISSGG